VDHLNHIWELDCPDIENLEDFSTVNFKFQVEFSSEFSAGAK